MTVVGSGWTADGGRWQLTVEPDPPGAVLMVEVTADGHRPWGTGCGISGPPTAAAVTTSGGDDAGPVVLLLHLRPDVRAAVVTLSDGTREDLVVHRLPGRPDRAAVLVHDRCLDVHRVDLYGPAAAPIA